MFHFIVTESYTIVQFPVAKITNLIESMDRRIQLILETKGQTKILNM